MLLPRRSEFYWIAVVVTLAVHSLLLFVVIEGRLPDVPNRQHLIAILPPEPDQVRAYPMPYSAPRPFIGKGISKAPLPPANPLPVKERPITLRVEPLTSPDTIVPHARYGKLVPDLGDGRLWVRPLPLPPKELAKRLDKSNAELVDSAVTQIIQAFLDSVGAAPGAEHAELPDWTKEVDGLKFGLDSKNIYIAGLKIPAAVLALLPIPAASNQQNAFKRDGIIYDDLRHAAQQAQTMDDFKEAIRKLREQRQRELEFDRAQRENPDSLAVQEEPKQ